MMSHTCSTSGRSGWKRLGGALLLGLGLLLSSTPLAVQAEVKEAVKQMSRGPNNAFTIQIEGADPKDVEDEWKDFLNQFDGKTKKDKKTNEYFSDNAIIKEMGNNTVDIYSTVVAVNGGATDVTVWFDLGGAFLSSQAHPDKFKIAGKMLDDFSRRMNRKMIGAKLEEQQKVLEKEQGKLEDLKKERDGLKKDIESYKERIQKAEQDIAANEKRQSEQQGALEKQKAAVEEIKGRLNELK